MVKRRASLVTFLEGVELFVEALNRSEFADVQKWLEDSELSRPHSAGDYRE